MKSGPIKSVIWAIFLLLLDLVHLAGSSASLRETSSNLTVVRRLASPTRGWTIHCAPILERTSSSIPSDGHNYHSPLVESLSGVVSWEGGHMSIRGVKIMGLPLMKLVRFRGLPILQQLHLEEQLLRTSSDNWCILNDGTDAPAIVMGISGKPYELLELGSVIQDQVPVIKRFTGGGTVIVDKNTVFVTFICNKDDVPGVQPYPRSIMSWSGSLYNQVFQGIDSFQLRENDYVFGDRKFGGNAQSITKTRWVHHTSFLWDYEVKNMGYLKLPARAPQYRLARDHTAFVCRMKEYMQRSDFIERTIKALESHFTLQQMNSDPFDFFAGAKCIESTKLLTQQELEEARSCRSKLS